MALISTKRIRNDDLELIRAAIEQFANTKLEAPEEALKIFGPHSKRDFIRALPMKTKPQRAAALAAYREDQAILRQWLHYLVEGKLTKVAYEVMDALESAELGVAVTMSSGRRPTLSMRPVSGAAGVRGLMALAVFYIIEADHSVGVRVCGLTEWTRTAHGRTVTDHACGNFIFNPPGTKPRSFCCPQHKGRHNRRLGFVRAESLARRRS